MKNKNAFGTYRIGDATVTEIPAPAPAVHLYSRSRSLSTVRQGRWPKKLKPSRGLMLKSI
jgi:hypothetical protein